MIWRVRRVLTGHTPDGKSTFMADGYAPNMKEMPSFPGLALTDLWETTGAPASNAGRADAADRPIKLEPPPRGTIVLKGEIYTVMETGEKLLRAGDVLIQRGTNHSWNVRGAEPCIVAAILVNATPLGSRPRKSSSKKKK